MSALMKSLVTIFFIALVIWLSIVNRGSFDFSLFPLVSISIPVPLPLIMLACIFVGFIWGALIVWLNGGKARSESRRLRREVKELEASEKNIS